MKDIIKAGGVFVTGTDTGVGKTVAAAALVNGLDGDYWKPIQSGTGEPGDTETVIRLLELDPARVHPCAYRLNAPLSPHEAARLDRVEIKMSNLRLPESARPVVVEGAGGVLVPLNERDTMVELMVHLGLPVVVVARSGLGTINHTLLSLEALRNRGLHVSGVVLNGPSNPANRKAIESHGNVRILFEMLPTDRLDKNWITMDINL